MEDEMPKKVQIFDALMEGFREAIARKKGYRVGLRLTQILRARRKRRSRLKKIRAIPSS